MGFNTTTRARAAVGTMVLLLAPSMMAAFSPVSVRAISRGSTATQQQQQKQKQRKQQLQRCLSLDPSDIAMQISQTLVDHHHLPSLDAFLSTLYAPAIDTPSAASQALFGPPSDDVSSFLSGVHSIPPKPGAIDVTANPVVIDIPDDAKTILDAAKARGESVIDPASIIREGGTAMPGFKKTGSLLPELNEPFYNAVSSGNINTPEFMQLQTGMLRVEAENLQKLLKLPFAAFTTIAFDFFLLSPGMDLVKEDIEDDEEDAVVQAVAGAVTRAIFLGIACFVALSLPF